MIQPANTLDGSINAAQIFKAMAHWMKGMPVTDYINRVVILYPPFETESNGEQVEGFFMRAGLVPNWTDKIQPKSRIAADNEEEQDRFIELKFADTKDEFIKVTTPNSEPFSRKIDLGAGKADTTTIENPLFEPTKELLTEPPEIGGLNGLTLPAMWDNTDGNVSHSIGPRIFYHYGLQEQITETGAAKTWSFESVIRNDMPYLAQVATASTVSGDPKVPIAFSDYREDGYRLFYQRWIMQRYHPMDLEFLVFLTYSEFLDFQFRDRVGFFYRDAYLLYQITSIRDFDIEAGGATPVEMKIISC
jgi:hypothetical protein